MGPIAIIEDNESLSESFKNILVKELSIGKGDAIYQFSSPEKTKSFINAPANIQTGMVFLVDINLGWGNEEAGLTLIPAIRARCHDALIIVYTGYPNFREKALENGADNFQVKGFDVDEVFENISEEIVSFWDSKESITSKEMIESTYSQQVKENPAILPINPPVIPDLSFVKSPNIRFHATFQPYLDDKYAETELEHYYFAQKLFEYTGGKRDIWPGITGQWKIEQGEDGPLEDLQFEGEEVLTIHIPRVNSPIVIDYTSFDTLSKSLDAISLPDFDKHIRLYIETIFILGLAQLYIADPEAGQSKVRDVLTAYSFPLHLRFLFQKKVFLQQFRLTSDPKAAQAANKALADLGMPIISEIHKGLVISQETSRYVEVELTNYIDRSIITTIKFKRNAMEALGLASPDQMFFYSLLKSPGLVGGIFELADSEM